MDRRQRTVFKEGLRGTGFDKMDRIFRRAYDAEQYRDMGRETCDVEALFRELPDMDLSVIMEDWESQQPRHFRVVKGNDVRLIKMSNP
jgi:hypothetical protein